MKSPRSVWCGQLAFLGLILVQSSWLLAQDVTLKREAISISDPKGYQVPLRTVPTKVLEITAPADGVIRQVLAKAGAKVLSQSEACRFDDEVQKLGVERAKANLLAAKTELKIAESKKDADLEELAKAHITAADADLRLAELQLERTAVKIPFAGELFKVEIIPGQFVRAGERLMTLVDASAMLVEVPVDRSLVKVGGDLEISIEKTPVKGKVQVILPPEKSFEPLRSMIHNLATAVVLVDNSKSEYYAGQTVFTKVIPQHPFGHVPTAALQNGGDGNRKVQVLRQGVVRDIPVQELTQMGPDRLFVSGAFSPDDEVIITSTTPLKDGQMIRSRTVAVAKPDGEMPAEPGAAKPAAPAVKKSNAPAF
ncbi:MAG: HlyD family efflux transporter periplasmic adaptor subunit [Planctomycetota bacterium]